MIEMDAIEGWHTRDQGDRYGQVKNYSISMQKDICDRYECIFYNNDGLRVFELVFEEISYCL